ncbi:MAG: MFS transporter [Candidatus Micrarchaeales archaeon]|nr:MFS transporter [Candidatus Micrarchaeales archaeon]
MNHDSKVLAVLVLATIMAAADSTVVLLAFPDITQSLHTDVSTSIWTILVYMLVTAVMTTQLGKVGDIYGRAKIFNAGFAIFAGASALCGASPNINFLIGFRILQGIGAAMLLANSGAIVADTFKKEHLGRAYGYISAGWGGGTLLGIILGGALTTLFGWPYIFYINVPIGLIAIVLGLRYIESRKAKRRNIDLSGMLLLGIALTLIAYDSISVADQGFSIADTILIIAGLLLAVVFLFKEKRTKDPLINLAVFRDRVTKFSLLAALFVSLSSFSIFFLVTLYLQGIVGLSPLNAALLLSPGALLGLFLSPSMGKLADRVGPRLVATLGVAAFAIAIIVYLMLQANSDPLIVLLATVASGLGTAFFFPANNAAIMSHAQSEHRGSLNGLLRTMTNIGGLMSYVIVIYIASTSIPRQVAFQVFIGTTKLLGGLTAEFMGGIHTALIGLFALMIAAALLSYARGKVAKRKGS